MIKLGLVIGGVFVVWQVVSCWWYPFARCWCCKGTGRHGKKVFRDCWWCGGRGRRLRVGRWLVDGIRRRRDDGRG